MRPVSHMSWIRPERSTRSRKTSFPISRLAIARPASRRVSSSSPPGSSSSVAARTSATASRFGKRFAPIDARPYRRSARQAYPGNAAALRGLDLHDLELHLRAARRHDLHGLALLATQDRLPDRRLVRQLVLGGVRLCRPDDEVLGSLLRVSIAVPQHGADRDDTRVDAAFVDHLRVRETLLEL